MNTILYREKLGETLTKIIRIMRLAPCICKRLHDNKDCLQGQLLKLGHNIETYLATH